MIKKGNYRLIAIPVVVLLMSLLLFNYNNTTQPNNSNKNSTTNASQDATAAPAETTKAQDQPDTAKLEKVTFRLNWTAQGSHAPIFYGIDQKIFEKYGIDLEAGEGKGSGNTVNLVATKGDTIGYSDCNSTFNLILQDAPVKVIAPVYTKLSSGVISIKENNITKPEDVKGKTIGITEGDGPHKLFGAFLKSTGIDEKDVTLMPMDATAKVPALLNKQVDAILGGFDDQPFQIEAKGFEPTVIAYADYGVTCVGMSLVAHNDTISGNPDMLKNFVQAYAESWAAAYKNPDAALDSLIKRFPDLDMTTSTNQLNSGFDCLLANPGDDIANVDEQKFLDSIELFKNYTGLSADAKAEDLFTMEFMPTGIKLEK